MRIASPSVAVSYGEAVRRGARMLAAALFAASIVVMGSDDSLGGVHVTVSLAILFASAIAGIVSLVARPSGRGGRAGTLAITDGALVMQRDDHERRIPFGDIAQGWSAPGSRVVVQTKRGVRITAEVAPDEGEALLAALGAAPADRVLRSPIVSAAANRLLGAPLGVLAAIVVLPILFATSFLVVDLLLLELRGKRVIEAVLSRPGLEERFLIFLLAWLLSIAASRYLARYLGARELVIGADGLAFKWKTRPAFIPHRDIVAVERDGWGVVVRTRDGRAHTLFVRPRYLSPLPQDTAAITTALARGHLEAREILYERIERARAVGGTATEPAAALAALDRGERPLTAWRDHLRNLLAKEAGYRSGAVDREQLGRVVSDPAAPPARRIAAAVALSGDGSAEAASRVRIAIEACADESLRRALAEAAEGEIDENLLAQVEAAAGTLPNRERERADPSRDRQGADVGNQSSSLRARQAR